MNKAIQFSSWLVILTTLTQAQVLAQKKSNPVAIVERNLETYGHTYYEVVFGEDGLVTWTWQYWNDGRKRARKQRVDPGVLNALFARLFPNSQREICIQYTGGVDAPVNMLFFSRTDSLNKLRKQGFAVRREQNLGVFQPSCTVEDQFDQVVRELESVAGPRPPLDETRKSR